MPILKLCDNGYWAVNGTPIYVPTSINISHDNIVSPESGRKESGHNHIVWVIPDVPKASLTYKRLTGAECKFLRDLMQGKVFNLTYYDLEIQTIEVYCGRCEYEQINLSAYASEGGLYGNFKANMILM